MSAIAKAMAAIQADVAPIAKSRVNQQQGYKFRGIDQVAEMLHPLLAKHGVLVLPRVVEQERSEYATKSGGTMHVAMLTIDWHFTATDGSELVVTTVGEGADSGDKAANKAMTAAQKYALTLAFTVPWSDQTDGDVESPAPRAASQPQRAPSASQKASPVRGAAINEKQSKLIWARTMAKADKLGVQQHDAQGLLRICVAEIGGVESSKDFPAAKFDELLARIEGWTLADFGEGEPAPDVAF